jgi:hypothetical protein
MSKGIATIIATIILVVITIGLISTAYLYFASIVQVGPVVSIASAYCNSDNDIMITIRNEGTSDLGLSVSDFLMDGTALSTGDVTGACLDSNIAAGGSATCNITSIGATQLSDGKLYNVLVLGPRNQAGGPVTC